jgi:hypothetical protein
VWIDAVGWGGACCLIGAYAIVSTGRVPGRGLLFQSMNFFGAAGMVLNGAYHGAWPSVGLNAVALLIASVALAGLHRDGLRPCERRGAQNAPHPRPIERAGPGDAQQSSSQACVNDSD